MSKFENMMVERRIVLGTAIRPARTMRNVAAERRKHRRAHLDDSEFEAGCSVKGTCCPPIPVNASCSL